MPAHPVALGVHRVATVTAPATRGETDVGRATTGHAAGAWVEARESDAGSGSPEAFFLSAMVRSLGFGRTSYGSHGGGAAAGGQMTRKTRNHSPARLYGSLLGVFVLLEGLALAGGALTTGGSGGSSALAAATRTALINGNSVSGSPSQEEQIAAALGLTVTVVPDATWATMKTAEFAAYDVLIVGDPTCGFVPAGVAATAGLWGPVVMGHAGGRTVAGNRVLVGTDPVFHDAGDFLSPGARGTIIGEGIAYSADNAGTTACTSIPRAVMPRVEPTRPPSSAH